MPPGPVYNWSCVAQSVLDIIANAAAIRAGQVYPKNAAVSSLSRKRRRRELAMATEAHLANHLPNSPTGLKTTPDKQLSPLGAVTSQQATVGVQATGDFQSGASELGSSGNSSISITTPPVAVPDTKFLPPANELSSGPNSTSSVLPPTPGVSVEIQEARTLISSKVPSSRIGRFFHYGGNIMKLLSLWYTQ
jgi:aarF domain-containing kinase